MKRLYSEQIRRCKPVIFFVAVSALWDFSQAGPALADLVAPETQNRPSGISIEDRVGNSVEWETVPADPEGIGIGAWAQGVLTQIPSSAADVWERATSWAQSQINAQSNDPYFNSRTFSSAYDDLWWLKSIQAPDAWGLSTGRGVTVAVVDTGVDYAHEDLSQNIWTNAGESGLDALGRDKRTNGVDDDGNGYADDWRGWDFANGDNDATDDYGHGTHVAGIIGAVSGNGKGISGVAPDSKILGIKVLDRTGSGSFDNIIRGIRYAADAGARIINLSLGAVYDYSLEFIRNYFSSYYNAYIKPIQDAILYAAGKGAVVVAAAGNSAVDVNRSVPSGFTETISVGATTPTGGLAYFSNTGQTLDLTAPGWDVLSLRAAGTSMGTLVGQNYTRASGTSMATPMVSGVVALLLAQDPMLDIAGIDRRLKFSARDLGAKGFDSSFGYGQVDALNAVTHDYYADGKLKTLWLLSADAKGMVRYDYDSTGKLVSSVGADGKKYSYGTNGDRIERYPSGRIKTRTDQITGTVYQYLDEDLDGKGLQRLGRRIDSDGTTVDYNYWDKTTKLRSTRTSRNGVLVQTQMMYANGQVGLQVDYAGKRRTETSYSTQGVRRQVAVIENNRFLSVTQFFDSGLASYEVLFKDGRPVQETFYNPDGTIRRVKQYYYQPAPAPASAAKK